MKTAAQTPFPSLPMAVKKVGSMNAFGARTDDAMAFEIQRALSNHPAPHQTAFNQIDVSVCDGLVTLNGYVATAAGKASAERIARQVAGVVSITNRLIADDDLQVLVAHEVAREPRLSSLPIFVAARTGVIRLDGQVNNAAQRVSAEQAAASVPSVRGVINLIQVPGVIVDAEQERVLQPGIGRQIFAVDGLVGVVERVVVNLSNRRVVAVGAQLDVEIVPQDCHVLIPTVNVSLVHASGVELQITRSEAMHAKVFDPSRFAAAAPGWQPPYPYRHEDILVEIEGRGVE